MIFRKTSVLLGTLFGIFAASEAALAQSGGDRHISDSLNMLLAVQTVECDIRIETIVNGKEYTARGRYEEQALPRPNLSSFFRSMYRLDINFSMNSPMFDNSEPNRMTLVCYSSEEGDQRLMERYTSIEGVKSFGMIDLTRLEGRLKEVNREMVFTQVSEVRNLGGLSGMMRQIQRFYEFSSPVKESLQDEEMIPALKLTGKLRNVHHKELLKKFGGLSQSGGYPADFPSDIEIWLGQHNDFPYKIRYLRRASEKSDQKNLLLQETFYKVVLNGASIHASRFSPLPPPDGVFPKDETDNFIKELGL